MKILCETQLVNRLIPNSKRRALKSTLAVAHHSSQQKATEIFIILFTANNQTGTRYGVKNNIEKVYTKFLNDGKATISFRNPQHDIQIKCNPIELKCFLRTLKLGLDGKAEFNKIGLSSLGTTAIAQKCQPIHKLVITRRSDYPIKGLPKTLKSLTICGINRARVDTQILFLGNLTCLNLSENTISLIPRELGKLNLVDVNFSSNSLGEQETQKCWDWLAHHPIKTSLKVLNISNNKLSHFPYLLVKLNNLVTLNLNNNEITRIPFAIRRMTGLKYFHIASNKLTSLPQTINRLRLDCLDVWKNNFLPKTDIYSQAEGNTNENHCVLPLWEIAARFVVSKNISYSSRDIPSFLNDILSETPLCSCGQLCFTAKIQERVAILCFENLKELVFSRDKAIYADCVFCSNKCLKKNS